MAKVRWFSKGNNAFVAKCDDYAIVIEGETMAEVMDQMQEAVKIYRNTFTPS